MPIVRHTP